MNSGSFFHSELGQFRSRASRASPLTLTLNLTITLTLGILVQSLQDWAAESQRREIEFKEALTQ